LVAGADIHEPAVEASVVRSVSTAGSPRLLIAHYKTEATSIDNMPIACTAMSGQPIQRNGGTSRQDAKRISRQDAKTLTEEITAADVGADSVKRGKAGLVGACQLEEEFEVKRD
jgi:hypothetical protein